MELLTEALACRAFVIAVALLGGFALWVAIVFAWVYARERALRNLTFAGPVNVRRRRSVSGVHPAPPVNRGREESRLPPPPGVSVGAWLRWHRVLDTIEHGQRELNRSSSHGITVRAESTAGELEK
jgi:hypothetical protein